MVLLKLCKESDRGWLEESATEDLIARDIEDYSTRLESLSCGALIIDTVLHRNIFGPRELGKCSRRYRWKALMDDQSGGGGRGRRGLFRG